MPVLSLCYEADAYAVLGRQERAALLRRYSPETASAEIRFAVAEDSEAISAVLEESFTEYRDRHTAAAVAATVINGEAVLKRMREGPVWVVVVGGTVVGTGAGQGGLMRRGSGFLVRT